MKYILVALMSLVISVSTSFGNPLTEEISAKDLYNKFNTPYKLVINDDQGGELHSFYQKYTLVRQLNGKVIIDGVCISGCALVLALVPKENICATDFGKFGFHSAKLMKMTPTGLQGEFSQKGSKFYFDLFPQEVIEKIHEKEPNWDVNGDKEHEQILFVNAQELVQKCPDFSK